MTVPVRASWVASLAHVVTPAKLNLCLRVVGRRPDGYHLLDSIAAPVTLFDLLSIRVNGSVSSGVEIRCVPEDALPDPTANLAGRAAALFLERAGCVAAVHLTLVKRIPIGAGLGGGSSDAAAVMRGLNLLFNRRVPLAELAKWGLELGADVPFFLYGRPARMRGIGEQLTTVPCPLTGPIVIAFPGVGLDTGAVYRKYDASLTTEGGLSTIRPPTSLQESPQQHLVNDLEAAAFQVRPEVRGLRRRLASLGAGGVLMTGSGSAVFGLWRHWDDARAVAQHLRAGGVWARVVEVLQQSPTPEVVSESMGGRQVW